MDKSFRKATIWLYTEYKRAAAMLPKILKRAAIFVVICMTIVVVAGFAMTVFSTGKEEYDARKVHIGYVAEESMLTDFAISYVENMESVKSLCVFDAVEEDIGKQLVEEGKLAALVVLPMDIVNEILSGSNAPAILYLPENAAGGKGGIYAVGSMLFEEFANAAVDMLETAQAEIYASSSLLNAFAQDVAIQEDAAQNGAYLQAMYDDINQFNLGVVTARENLFYEKRLSVTENDTYVVYYASAIFTIYMLLSGLFFGAFCKRSRLEQEIAAKRLGISYAAQLGFRWLVGILLMVVVALLPFFVFFIPNVKAILTVEWSVIGIAMLFLIVLFMTAYFMLIYQLVEKHQSALTAIGLLALLQAYLSGCLIPSVLLPQFVAKIGGILPAAFIKAGVTVLLAGSTRGVFKTALGLLLWGIFCLVLAWIAMHKKERDKNSVLLLGARGKRHIPSVFMVMLRRLFHKKSIWICMIFVVVLSAAIVSTEKKAGAQITAAVYDEEGIYRALLTKQEGIVNFVCYDREEDVRKAVLKGEAECGYVLPENLKEQMIARKANQLITVYQDEDAVAVPVVNEILFGRIFRHVSLEWYRGYIMNQDIFHGLGVDQSELSAAVDRAFSQQIEENTTFHFEIIHIGASGIADTKKQEARTYPIFMVVIVTVILCAGQGVLQVIADIREQRFYKRNRFIMSVLTIALPVVLGLLTGFLTMAVVRFLA